VQAQTKYYLIAVEQKKEVCKGPGELGCRVTGLRRRGDEKLNKPNYGSTAAPHDACMSAAGRRTQQQPLRATASCLPGRVFQTRADSTIPCLGEKAQKGVVDMAFASSEASLQDCAFTQQHGNTLHIKPSSPQQSVPATSDKVCGIRRFICACSLTKFLRFPLLIPGTVRMMRAHMSKMLVDATPSQLQIIASAS
jgi:hypothetical protein